VLEQAGAAFGAGISDIGAVGQHAPAGLIGDTKLGQDPD
jgi:hypothetical protein